MFKEQQSMFCLFYRQLNHNDSWVDDEGPKCNDAKQTYIQFSIFYIATITTIR